MLVKELRKALADMPGEIGVFVKEGTGIKSAAHIFRMNLIGVEQFCELITYLEHDHTPQLEDALIERQTGFKNRDELLEGYKELKEELERMKGETL